MVVDEHLARLGTPDRDDFVIVEVEPCFAYPDLEHPVPPDGSDARVWPVLPGGATTIQRGGWNYLHDEVIDGAVVPLLGVRPPFDNHLDKNGATNRVGPETKEQQHVR